MTKNVLFGTVDLIEGVGLNKPSSELKHNIVQL